jgi:hypothetical protein
MEERGKVVCLAKLAEQAERYDGEGSACPVLFCFSSVQCRRYSLVGGVWRGIRVLLRRFCVFASIFAHLRAECLNTGSISLFLLSRSERRKNL